MSDMKTAEEILAASSLPAEVIERIRAVVAASNLSDDRAADVTRELVAHFEDGLAAGNDLGDLLASFGDDDLAADLIARAKPRADRAAAQREISAGRDLPLAAAARNVRYGMRRMAQRPGFTAIAVLSLAIGIGANTAMFSLVNSVILRTLPIDEPEQLMEIYRSEPDFQYNIFSYPNFRDVRDNTTDIFEGISVSGYSFPAIDAGNGIELAPAEVVSGNYFSLLGVEPEVGRLFGLDDDIAKGAHPVVVLGYGYWQRAFGGDPGAVGQSLRIAGREYEIVGVVPSWYEGNVRTFQPDLFMPVQMINDLSAGLSDQLEQRGSGWLFAKARLREGVTIQEAQARLDLIATDLKRDHPDYWDPTDQFLAYPTANVIMWPPIDRFLVPIAGLFMVLVGLVLLVACANLASFLLAQAMDRQKEISIRLALGATRRQIVGQLLTETVMLSIVGGLAGIGISMWILRTLLTVDMPLPVPIVVPITPDARVMAFTLLVSTLAGVLFGIAPAMQGNRGDVAATLKEGGSGANRPRRVLLRNGLVVTQVALSLVLLVAAGLFIRSARATASIDPGFGNQPTGVLTVALPSTRYDEAQGMQMLQRLEDRFRELPGIDSVGMIDNLHLSLTNTMYMDFNVDGFEPPEGRRAFQADRATVDAGFFDAAGVEVIGGRNFSDVDHAESAAVAIVSRALAERFWPGESAIGRVIRQDRATRPDLTIIGVASDAKIRTINEPPRMFVYTPLSQEYNPFMTFIARTTGDAEAAALAMLSAGRELDPELMVFETKTVERHIGIQLLPARLAAVVLTAFAALTLFLASIGLYGVVSYAVAQRTREVGIRISLGAEYSEMVRMLTAGGMGLVAIGGGIGLVLSAGVAYAMSMMLYGVSAFDPITFVAVPMLLLAVAFFASYMPARRASRVDPVIALRAE